MNSVRSLAMWREHLLSRYHPFFLIITLFVLKHTRYIKFAIFLVPTQTQVPFLLRAKGWDNLSHERMFRQYSFSYLEKGHGGRILCNFGFSRTRVTMSFVFWNRISSPFALVKGSCFLSGTKPKPPFCYTEEFDDWKSFSKLLSQWRIFRFPLYRRILTLRQRISFPLEG